MKLAHFERMFKEKMIFSAAVAAACTLLFTEAEACTGM